MSLEQLSGRRACFLELYSEKDALAVANELLGAVYVLLLYEDSSFALLCVLD